MPLWFGKGFGPTQGREWKEKMEKKTYVGKDATDHLMSLKDGDYVIIDGNKVFHLTIDDGDAVRFDHVHNVIYVNRNEVVPCVDAAKLCGITVDSGFREKLDSLC